MAVVSQRNRVDLLHIQLSGVWYRFYLDAGLLFWAEGSGPDAEDDLMDGDRYLDLGEAIHTIGAAVSDIVMEDGRFKLTFDNGARLGLKSEVRGAGAVVVESVTSE